MPRTETSSAQRRMPFAAADVFRVVADPETQPRWWQDERLSQTWELSVRYASGPRVGINARYIRLREDEGGHQKVDRLETVVFEGPERVRFSDGASFVLEPDGDGVVVTAFDEQERSAALSGVVRRMMGNEPKLASSETLAGRLERIEQVVAARAATSSAPAE